MMKNNKFIIRPNQEQAVQKIQSMIDGFEPDDSIMIIQVKEHSIDKVEVTSANTLHSKHLPQIKSTLDQVLERVFEDLVERDPLAAFKVLSEMAKNEKD